MAGSSIAAIAAAVAFLCLRVPTEILRAIL
jgi:hypothetical protein